MISIRTLKFNQAINHFLEIPPQENAVIESSSKGLGMLLCKLSACLHHIKYVISYLIPHIANLSLNINKYHVQALFNSGWVQK